MRVCSFCGENNEDWMNICQRCGNSIVNADVRENENRVDSYQASNVKYTTTKKEKKKFIDDDINEPKEKRIIENLDLKIILIILLIILICLIIYTISTL